MMAKEEENLREGDATDSKVKKIARIVGNILMLSAIVFIVARVYSYRSALESMISARVVEFLLLFVLLYSFLVIGNSLIYGLTVSVLSGMRLSMIKVVWLYTKTNTYKYLPGNVLHLIGRDQFVSEFDVPRYYVHYSTVCELISTLIGSLIVSLFLAGDYVTVWIKERLIASGYVSVLAFAVVLLLVVIVILIVRLRPRFLEGKAVSTVKVFGILIPYFCIMLFCGVLLFVGGLSIVFHGLTLSLLRLTGGIYSFAWLIGFITPGASGGMGVREVMLTATLGNIVPSEILLFAVVFNRIVTTGGDLLAYLFAIVANTVRNKSGER